MAKRLSDTDKWKKPFFKALPAEYKLFWLYILDDCDHAGLWHVDIEVAEIRLGIKLSLEKSRGFFGERVVEIDNGTKWFVPDFISFQYGAFNESNKMYKAIMPVLLKYHLIPLLSPINGVKVKEKVIVQVKDKEDSTNQRDRQDFLTNQAWKEQFCISKGLTIEQLEQMQKDWLSDVDLSGKPVDSYKRYFLFCFNKNGIRTNVKVNDNQQKMNAAR